MIAGGCRMLDETWRKLLRRFIAHDIPDDMAACFECDVRWCPNERFETCTRRLTRAAARTSEVEARAETDR
jgi:hypothetical protein